MKNHKFWAIVFAIVLACVALVGVKTSASASDEECVPSEARTEVIEHPEVSHVVHHDAITHVVNHPAVTHVVHHDPVTHDVTIVDQEATSEVWANFSPNHQQGPFEGAPSFPDDERGTWHMHSNIPGGHEGADGVYQRDNPHSGRADWFYRHNATEEVTHTETVVDEEAYDETVVDQEAYDETVVDTPAWTETIIDQAAWTETIEHPAVTCEGEKPDPIVTIAELSDYKCGHKFEVHTTVTTTADYVLENGEWVLGEPVSVSEEEKVPVTVTPCEKEPENPNIEQPGPGEEITYQSFDGDGNLVEQRVSKPIPAHAEQEGM